MISIDSQIWIYYFDSLAPENINVISWMEGKDNDGILFKEKIVLNAIIPIEVGHTLFRNKHLDPNVVLESISSIISLDSIEIHEITTNSVLESLSILSKLRLSGIGCRDALILSTLKNKQIFTIATHDKNILKIIDLERIDPTFNPPLILKIGEEFDENRFKR